MPWYSNRTFAHDFATDVVKDPDTGKHFLYLAEFTQPFRKFTTRPGILKESENIYRVARFVPHYFEALALRSAFNFKHLQAFESGQPGVGEVEGDRETRHVIRGEPLFGQPCVRLEPQTARFELLVKCCNSAL